MSRINILDKKTANAIKAGEVIERPVSVVKELFDNSIDSGATSVTIEFRSGGITMIRVSDNGVGMDREDAKKAFLIHATSKIACVEDLQKLSTMGFRGEALPSIAACSRVELITKQADSNIATRIVYDDGQEVSVEDCAADNGTTVTVRDLFYNVPARYKFLKKDTTESTYIAGLVEKLAIVNPHVKVKLIKDGTTLLTTPGNGSMLDTIYAIHGKQIASMLIPVEFTYENIRVSGFTSRPELTRGNRTLELVYVNDRCIKSSTATAAIDEAYRNSVMKGKFPVCFLTIYADPSEVDCNIHPQKIEVKFSNDSNLFRAIYHAVGNALESIKPVKQEPVEDELFSLLNGKEEPKASVDLIVEDKTSPSASPSPSSAAVFSKPSGFRNDGVTKPSQMEIRASNNILNILSGLDSVSGRSKDSPSDTVEDTIEAVSPAPAPVMAEPVISSSDEFKKPYNSDIEILYNSKIVGTFFATYIVLQSDDAVYIVDQHAAHERVLYEEFLQRALANDKDSLSEPLLVPDIVTVSSQDYIFALDNKEQFREYGFDIEAFGEREIAIRSVPVMRSLNAKPSKIFADLLTELRKELPVGNDQWYLKIATAACKAAIKGHDLISVDEVKELLRRMLTLDDPYHCPHGRPTFIKLTNEDLEKMFKRIV